MYKYLSLFLGILFLVQGEAWACAYAYQHTYLPLGMGDGAQWAVLKVEMVRYAEGDIVSASGMGNRPGMMDMGSTANVPMAWKGHLSLYLLDIEGNVQDSIWSVQVDDLDNDNYAAQLMPYTQQALNKARAHFTQFEAFFPPSLASCKTSQNCAFNVRAVFADSSGRLQVQVDEHPAQDVIAPKYILQKVENQYHIPYTEWSKTSFLDRLAFAQLWRCKLLRKYRMGKYTLLVYTLHSAASGCKSATGAAPRWQMHAAESIEAFAVGDDVIFHDKRFDTIQVLSHE